MSARDEISLVKDLHSIPEGQPCQEASPMSGHRYIPCGSPAMTIIYSGDRDARPYYMCIPCAMHNLRNRGAAIVYSSDGVIRKMMHEKLFKVKVCPDPKMQVVKVQSSGPPAAVEGWTELVNSSKRHFFRAGRSLCGQWMLPPAAGSLSIDETADDCKNCQRLRDAEKEKKA